MGVDVGTVRIGVALSPAGTSVAVPLETVDAGRQATARIAALAADNSVSVIYVGDPIRLNGEVGPAAESARRFAKGILESTSTGNSAATSAVRVQMVDERLTSAQSGKQMRDAGRNTRKSRSVLDQAAAVAILQNALERERVTGRLAGVSVGRDD